MAAIAQVEINVCVFMVICFEIFVKISILVFSIKNHRSGMNAVRHQFLTGENVIFRGMFSFVLSDKQKLPVFRQWPHLVIDH